MSSIATFRNRQWPTKRGHISIKNMEDDHLKRTLSILKKMKGKKIDKRHVEDWMKDMDKELRGRQHMAREVLTMFDDSEVAMHLAKYNIHEY